LLESLVCERSVLTELRATTDKLIVANLRSSLIKLGTCYLALLKQYDRLSHILLREFRTHTAAATEFQAHHEEHVQLIMSYLLKATHRAQCPPIERPEVVARVFYYNIIVIAFIEESPSRCASSKNMVDLLLNGILVMPTVRTFPRSLTHIQFIFISLTHHEL